MRAFASWSDVIRAARAGQTLYYRAPLDITAVPFRPRLTAYPSENVYVIYGRRLRLYPPGCIGRGKQRMTDPFMADACHLNRFFEQT